jgi:Nuclease-related domain
MAWPKPRSRRSPVPVETSGNGGGGTPEEARPHAVTPEQAGRPSWPSVERWPSAHATVAPVPAETQPSAEESDETDPADRPFWETWGRADLDEPDDGFGEDGPADDAVTDVDPRPKRSWDSVVTTAGVTREQPKAEGIGQHLGSVAHLSAHPRRRAWQWRVFVAVVVGLVAGFLLGDWRLGLTFAVLAAIADTIIRSRTVFKGPAGVRLTKAQKHTARQLSSLHRKGYRAMHILPIPDSEEQIDHLVIGPAGVFAIDSEDWDKRMPVRTSNHRQLWHGPRSMKDRLEHAHWEAGQAASLLSAEMGSPVTVRAAMAVYGPKIPWDVAEIRDVDVFSGDRLRSYLRRRARRRDNHPLNASEIERVDKAAHAAFRRDQTA